MKPLGLSAYAVARAIGSTPITISLICRGKRAVSAEMALKLGRLFGISPELWIGIQADYDLEVARLKAEGAIERRVQPLPLLRRAAAKLRRQAFAAGPGCGWRRAHGPEGRKSGLTTW